MPATINAPLPSPKPSLETPPYWAILTCPSPFPSPLSLLQILPNGSVWYPPFLESVLAAALEKDAVKVTEKMVAGPNLNNGFKLFIPVIALLQV